MCYLLLVWLILLSAGLIFYAIIEYSLISAAICVVVLSLGIICIVAMAAQTVHFWREVQRDTSVDDATLTARSKQSVVGGHVLSHRELSTLV